MDGFGYDWQKAIFNTLLLCAIFIPLERLLPLARRSFFRRGLGTDVAHFYLSSVLTTFLFGLVAAVVVAGLGGYVMPAMDAAIPGFSFAAFQEAVAGLPLWLQILGVLVVADLGGYVAHRLQHEVPFFWRFHAIHHCSEQLDWLSTSRIHPFDQVFKKTLKFVPPFLMGFSPEALGIGYAILIFALFIYQFAVHANVHLPLGWLEYGIITPRFHHWHHAKVPVNKNYADLFPFFDLLFGSFHLPRGAWPSDYGTHAPVPLNWLAQMAHPLNPRARFSNRAPGNSTDRVARHSASANRAEASEASSFLE